MAEIYCQIHTPVNIEEENKFFLPPIIFEGNLYVIKEKKLQDILLLIGYFQEYIQFTRENGYKHVSKWLIKKNLLNEGFLEAVSQYWIEDIHLKQVFNYKYFQKKDFAKPTISDNYLKNIFQKIFLYNYIKKNQDKFNEKTEKELNIIENELSFIKNKNNLDRKLLYYKDKIFEIILENFFADVDVKKILKIINDINFSCETLLSKHDLYVYKTANINGYKDFNFKLTNISYSECLKENKFIKFYANSASNEIKEDKLKYIFEELKIYSQLFSQDMIDFGAAHLEKIINCEVSANKKKFETVRYQKKEFESSNVALIQRTPTIISETEDHIIARHNSLKNHTNIYFAPNKELITLLTVLNTDTENLKRLNNLFREKQNKIEDELIKFTFKKGNLPYSAYGFASLNF